MSNQLPPLYDPTFHLEDAECQELERHLVRQQTPTSRSDDFDQQLEPVPCPRCDRHRHWTRWYSADPTSFLLQPPVPDAASPR